MRSEGTKCPAHKNLLHEKEGKRPDGGRDFEVGRGCALFSQKIVDGSMIVKIKVAREVLPESCQREGLVSPIKF